MESDNPFIQRIHTSDDQLEKYEIISDSDKEKYHLRGQNYKFSNPEKFVFIDMPVEFIAMEVDEDSNVKSMLLYLDERDTLLETLEIAFGPADISMNMEGQVEYESETRPHSYASYTWIREKYRMTFSILPLKDGHSEQALKSQLYIK